MNKKIIALGLLTASLTAVAQDSQSDISHSFFEVGYGVVDLAGDPNAWHIEANAEITEHFTIGGEWWQLENGGAEWDHYEVNFGYHTGVTDRTDFFTKAHYGREESIRGTDVYGLALGTRSALSDHFELHTELKYNEVDRATRGYYIAEVKGVYKFNQNQGLSFAVQSWDGEGTGLEVGYRFNF